jgi:hypothetical protein
MKNQWIFPETSEAQIGDTPPRIFEGAGTITYFPRYDTYNNNTNNNNNNNNNSNNMYIHNNHI